MRRRERQGDLALGYEIFGASEVAHLAGRTGDGALVLRAFNPILLGDWLYFHGSHAGEKIDLGGEVIVSAHRIVADVPSYFIDAALACPATTYYESVEARGTLSVIQDAPTKDAVLQAMMERYQPEGGHAVIDSTTELYRKQVLATRVIGLPLTNMVTKRSMGQDRPSERVHKVVTGLWRRGQGRDLAAIDPILALSPEGRPAFLRGPHQTRFVVNPTRTLAAAHAGLLRDEYWRQQSSEEEIVQAVLGSAAWVGLLDEGDQLVSAGRAVTDGRWTGMVCDVVVAPNRRGSGLGEAVMQLLLDHSAVRGVKRLRLGTRDAMAFYERLGFRAASEFPLPFPNTEMIRRPPPDTSLR
jgi:uncharacterized protein